MSTLYVPSSNAPVKSRELLESFITYCLKHPDERFWQALRNWCGWDYVLLARELPSNEKAKSIVESLPRRLGEMDHDECAPWCDHNPYHHDVDCTDAFCDGKCKNKETK